MIDLMFMTLNATTRQNPYRRMMTIHIHMMDARQPSMPAPNQ